MEAIVLLFIVLFQHGVTTENADNRRYIFAHELDDVILPLPKHLQNQTENVLWKKGEEHIASSDGNGTLRHVDPNYREILNISYYNGSLILKAQSWRDGEEYSANMTLRNNSHYFIHYRVRVQKLKFIAHNKDPKIVHTIVGGTVTLPLDSDINKNEIEEIDWLTDKWNYFAVTKVGGDVTILENDYRGCLNSSTNGSLIFQKVVKRHERTFRACIFLKNGIIREQLFKILMDEPKYTSHVGDPPSVDTSSKEYSVWELPTLVALVAATVLCFAVLISIIIKKKAYESPTTEKQDKMNEEKRKLHNICHV